MRHCTMPKLFGIRDWYEKRFGILCEIHDAAYVLAKCKLCADRKLAVGIWRKGYPVIALLTFLAVNLPWVWVKYWRLWSDRQV